MGLTGYTAPEREDPRLLRAIFYCPELGKEVEMSIADLDFNNAFTYEDGTINTLCVDFACKCGNWHEVEVKN